MTTQRKERKKEISLYWLKLSDRYSFTVFNYFKN